MPRNLKCEVCEQKINQVSDGLVEYIIFQDEEGNNHIRDFRIVHEWNSSPLTSDPSRCQFDEQSEFTKDGGIILDSSLESFQGTKGLEKLKRVLEESQIPSNEVSTAINIIKILDQ